jgi:hypothetical protein
MLRCLSAIPEPKLDSLLITEYTDSLVLGVPDSVLLEFVNGRGPPPENVSRSSIVCSASTFDIGMTLDGERFKPGRRHHRCFSGVEVNTIAEHLLQSYQSAADGPLTVNHEEVSETGGQQSQPDVTPDGDHIADQVDAKLFVKVKLGKENVPEPVDQATEDLVELMTRCRSATHWLFKNPDGRLAIGDEPLEFFSDWEDSDGEANDNSESKGWESEDDESHFG